MQRDQTHVTGMRRGTPMYISPELLKSGKISRAVDVYAYGVLLWELYHGQTAWTHAVET